MYNNNALAAHNIENRIFYASYYYVVNHLLGYMESHELNVMRINRDETVVCIGPVRPLSMTTINDYCVT